MKFPVQRRKSKAGLEAKPGQCPVCHGVLYAEPGSFAFINGGALRRIDKVSAMPAPDLIAFLSIGFHSAHSGKKHDPSADLHVADEVRMGQFEFYFCSTKRIRQFFNECVDALEEKLCAQREG